MKKLWWIFLSLFLVVAYPAFAGETLTTVSVTSATAGTQLVASIGGGVTVTLPSSAAVAVWVARTSGTCSSIMTSINGVRITAGNGYQFGPSEDKYYSQLCGLLESGVSAVTVYINAW